MPLIHLKRSDPSWGWPITSGCTSPNLPALPPPCTDSQGPQQPGGEASCQRTLTKHSPNCVMRSLQNQFLDTLLVGANSTFSSMPHRVPTRSPSARKGGLGRVSCRTGPTDPNRLLGLPPGVFKSMNATTRPLPWKWQLQCTALNTSPPTCVAAPSCYTRTTSHLSAWGPWPPRPSTGSKRN